MRPEERVSHTTNSFVFSFECTRERLSAAGVDDLPRVLPLDEDEAHAMVRVGELVGAELE